MPKKSDQLAGGYDSENTGGLLTGLLAEEENIDRRAMFRLGTWGVVSVGAVVVAVLANQSAIKTRRDEVAALDLTRQSMQISAIARESQNEARRLASAIDTLNTDRDRMYTRLTGLEQGLESVTGAIAKQKSATGPVAAPAAGATSAANPSGPASQPIAQNAPSEPAPMVGPVATTAAAALAAERAHAETRRSANQAAAVVAATPTPSPVPSPTPVTTSAMPVMPRSMMAPPDPAAPRLIAADPPPKPIMTVPAPTPSLAPPQAAALIGPMPPVAPAPAASPVPAPAPEKLAAIDNNTPAVAPTPPAPIEVKHTEFGIDVGGANSVAGLRALWRGLLKYRSNAALAGMQPIIVVKEATNGLGMQLRLVAGPISDAAAAARICATIGSKDRSCETTVYDGQRLAMKTDDAQGSAEAVPAKPGSEKFSGERSSAERPSSEPADTAPDKPSVAKPGSNKYFHRRRGSYVPANRTQAQAPPPVVEEPPKQEASGLSSFFSRAHPQPQQ